MNFLKHENDLTNVQLQVIFVLSIIFVFILATIAVLAAANAGTEERILKMVTEGKVDPMVARCSIGAVREPAMAAICGMTVNNVKARL